MLVDVKSILQRNTCWIRVSEREMKTLSDALGYCSSSLVIFLSPSALLSDEGRADVCGRKASHFFSLAESLRSPAADPFIWVFIRPPWSPTGSCCKAVVFDRLKAECDTNMVGFSTLELADGSFHRPCWEIKLHSHIGRACASLTNLYTWERGLYCVSCQFTFYCFLQEKKGPLLHCLARVLQLFEVSVK